MGGGWGHAVLDVGWWGRSAVLLSWMLIGGQGLWSIPIDDRGALSPTHSLSLCLPPSIYCTFLHGAVILLSPHAIRHNQQEPELNTTPMDISNLRRAVHERYLYYTWHVSQKEYVHGRSRTVKITRCKNFSRVDTTCGMITHDLEKFTH